MIGDILVVVSIVLAVWSAVDAHQYNRPYRSHLLLVASVICLAAAVVVGANTFLDTSRITN